MTQRIKYNGSSILGMGEIRDKSVRHFSIEVKKKGDDDYTAALTDNSIDRDGEFMSPEAIKEHGDVESLPMLANHDNSMQSFIGGWTNPKIVESDGKTSLEMKPSFFSDNANPLSQQIKKQIDEASDMGLAVGVSIGFIPIEGTDTDKGYKHTKIEIVEGTIVPVQSNRTAAITLRKMFGIRTGDIVGKKETVKEKKVKAIVDKFNKAVAGKAPEDAIQDLAEQVVNAAEAIVESAEKIDAVVEDVSTMEERLATLEGTKAEDGEDENPEDKEEEEEEDKEEETEEEKKLTRALTKALKPLTHKIKKLEQRAGLKGKNPAALGISKNPADAKTAKPYNAAEDYCVKKGFVTKDDEPSE